MTTLKDSLAQLRNMQGRAAVEKMVANYLRTRYLPRDSSPALAQVRGDDGSPVAEEQVEAFAAELEADASDLEKTYKALLSREVGNDGR